MKELLSRLPNIFKCSREDDPHSIISLANYIHKLMNKEKGKDVDPKFRLKYNGQTKDIKFVLVARETIHKHGQGPYIHCLKYAADKGVDFVFVIACGSIVKEAAKIVNQAQRKKLFDLYTEYPSEKSQVAEIGKYFLLTRPSSTPVNQGT